MCNVENFVLEKKILSWKKNSCPGKKNFVLELVIRDTVLRHLHTTRCVGAARTTVQLTSCKFKAVWAEMTTPTDEPTNSMAKLMTLVEDTLPFGVKVRAR